MAQALADIQFVIGDKPFTFRLSAKAWAALQDHWDLANMDQALVKLADMESGKLHAKDLGAILWAGLRTHHPDIDQETAFTLLDDMGVPSFMVLVQRAATAALPEGGGNASANPPLWRRMTAAMSRGR